MKEMTMKMDLANEQSKTIRLVRKNRRRTSWTGAQYITLFFVHRKHSIQCLLAIILLGSFCTTVTRGLRGLAYIVLFNSAGHLFSVSRAKVWPLAILITELDISHCNTLNSMKRNTHIKMQYLLVNRERLYCIWLHRAVEWGNKGGSWPTGISAVLNNPVTRTTKATCVFYGNGQQEVLYQII